MALTAKGQPLGLATLDGDGKVPAAQLPAGSEVTPAESVANVTEADADETYDSDTADLINELKTKLNALLASLRSAGLMEE